LPELRGWRAGQRNVPRAPLPPSGFARHHGRISVLLVVDDDPTFRRLARRLLGAYGLEVAGEAGTVAEALPIADRLRPTGALVDVELPDGNGFELAAKLALLPWRPRIIITSAQADSGFAKRAEQVGAAAFVLKDDLPTAPLITWFSDR
jgi:DNA-binding NarL/FixJ family response regulator